MNKKVLFVSHTANFSKFNIPFMKWFREKGFRVDYASAGEEKVKECDNHFKVCFNRSPYSLSNLKAYRELKRIIETERYSLIHCHTPTAGVISRLAARNLRKSGLKLIYTAHGLHFYKGAPIINWCLFYPIEKYLSKHTDCLITINDEDYNCVLNRNFKAKRIVKIDGVGVDLDKFKPISTADKMYLREKYGFNKNDFILIYVAEFTKEKNHKFIIECLPEIRKKIHNLKVLFIGKGSNLEKCQKLVSSLGLDQEVKFLGYRYDVNFLQQISDIAISSSAREGLPINVVEAMASGLPIVCSEIRGHIDLMSHGDSGYLFPLNDTSSFQNEVLALYSDPDLRKKIGQHNVLLANKYSVDRALESMAKIYNEVLEYSNVQDLSANINMNKTLSTSIYKNI